MRNVAVSVAAVLALGLALALAGCEPFRITDETKYDSVITKFDDTANFGVFQTFALPDTIAHLGDADITRAYDNDIRKRVRSNMVLRGYTEVADPRDADVLVNIGITTSDYLVSSGGYWCDYWYYWYGCGYPYYPTYTYTYTVGTLLLVMTDEDRRGTGTAPGIWIAAVSDLIQGATTAQRALNNIDQAFVQSPYIQAAPTKQAQSASGTR